MKKYNDLSNKIFGELKVVRISKRGESGKHIEWECLCSCGKTCFVKSNSLVRGHTKSCGHLIPETTSKLSKKYNEYIMIDEETTLGILSETDGFLIDSSDYEKIKRYKWTLDDGYAVSHDTENNFKKVRLHRIIIGAKEGEIVDHINRNRLDNRKENLRLVTREENARNVSISKNNKTGIIGVHRSENNTWRVSIQGKNSGKRHKEFREAVIERLSLEKQIFGIDFAPQRDLFEEYGI
jgi:hypothetical protein